MAVVTVAVIFVGRFVVGMESAYLLSLCWVVLVAVAAVVLLPSMVVIIVIVFVVVFVIAVAAAVLCVHVRRLWLSCWWCWW